MVIPLRYLISLWTLIPVFVQGQAMPPPEVTVQFTVFSRKRLEGLCYLPTKLSQPMSLRFFTQNKSERYRYTGSADVAFYAVEDWARYAQVGVVAVPLVKPLPRPVAVATLPSGMREALLLFIPLPETQPDGIKFLVLPVDDDPARFPVGHIAVVNATGRHYTGQVGRKVLDLPQGVGSNVSATGPVDFRLACFDGGQWVFAGHHFLNVGPRTRVRLVLFPATAPTGVGPVIRALVDEPHDKTGMLTAARLAPGK
ncbi:MAG: hypothetical protein H2172_14690 [Opitutus sp.]|nr:hypothetical protein [Opitutus sp.]MCS6247895.1 hypothetical protein [Opitutus sp.]MCS6273408.1 hypothetical protein [Opitutus sp.]MCS6277474.1 hypothetical protein [Opitutus sp.]MCS6300591.1 hypothetical protein [Opitutus sp.]